MGGHSSLPGECVDLTFSPEAETLISPMGTPIFLVVVPVCIWVLQPSWMHFRRSEGHHVLLGGADSG